MKGKVMTENIYNYQKNIKINKTVSGDVVLTMNEPILITIINCVYDASEYLKSKGLMGSYEDISELWKALYEKDDASCLRNDYSTIKRIIAKKNNLTDAEKDVLIEMLTNNED